MNPESAKSTPTKDCIKDMQSSSVPKDSVVSVVSLVRHTETQTHPAVTGLE